MTRVCGNSRRGGGKRFAAVLAMCLLAGCASGPKYGAIKSTIPPIQADKSRITFYREAGLGGIVAVLRVYVDGVVVGSVRRDRC